MVAWTSFHAKNRRLLVSGEPMSDKIIRSVLPLLVLFAGGCLSPADSPETEMFVGRQGPIVYGKPDVIPSHDAVVLLYMHQQDAGGMCTGTLISRNVVLTAAHCVASDELPPTGVPPKDVFVAFGRVFSYGMKRIQASEILVHPDYDSGWPAYDIALVRLAEPAPAYIVPIPYLPANMALTQDDVGVEVNFSGFGQTENNTSGALLEVSANVVMICEDPNGCQWKDSRFGPVQGPVMAPQTLCYDQNPGGPCSGDSGGPAFVTIEGVEYVAGVTSYGDQTCSLFGCSTKVDAFEDFIAPFLGELNGEACTTDDECGSGHCIEGLCCQTACDSTCNSCSQPGSLGICTSFANGTSCSDDNLCSMGDACQAGVCTPVEYVGCRASECRPVVECNPSSGDCEGLALADGTACSTGTCQGGECEPAVAEGCGCAGFGVEAGAVWALGLLLVRRRKRYGN